MPRPIRARYDLSALGHNLAVVRRCAPQSRVWAVITANAYGHSLLRAARALGASDGYALLDIAEALRLRDAGVTKPILLLEGCFQGEDITTAARHDLTVVVHHEGQLQMLERAAAAKPLEVYLKLNSGMNRLGFAEDICPPARLQGGGRHYADEPFCRRRRSQRHSLAT